MRFFSPEKFYSVYTNCWYMVELYNLKNLFLLYHTQEIDQAIYSVKQFINTDNFLPGKKLVSNMMNVWIATKKQFVQFLVILLITFTATTISKSAKNCLNPSNLQTTHKTLDFLFVQANILTTLRKQSIWTTYK